MKNERGMTLVILVLIIIILLGLAAVSVYTVAGPDGIINAKNKETTENSANIANSNLATALATISKDFAEEKIADVETLPEAVTKERLQKLLPDYIFTDVITPKTGTDGTIKFEKDGHKYTVTVTENLQIKNFVEN